MLETFSKEIIFWIFFQFKCCGSENITDWKQTKRWHGKYVPPSCCQKEIQPEFSCRRREATQTGCKRVLLRFYLKMFDIFFIIGVVFCLVQVINFRMLIFEQINLNLYFILVHRHRVCLLFVFRLELKPKECNKSQFFYFKNE